MLRKIYFILFIILSGAAAFMSEATIDVATGVVISGGRGTIEVLEFPQTTAWQVAECTATELDFPPYFRTVNCTVQRKQARDFSSASYGITPLTESNSQITALSNSLKSDSIFETSVRLADWVYTNINYDLALGTVEEAAQTVFTHRKGTCDEFTHLFLSLSKVRGYDARYISGFAYGDQGWLPHAWAEIKTEYGWLPFDATFGQYGALDALHISTYKGADGNSSFVQASYTGETSLNEYFDLHVLSSKNVSFDLSTTATSTGGGGDVLIEISTNNPFSFPIAFSSRLITPSNFEMEPLYSTDYIIMPPGENKLYWVYRVQEIEAGTFFYVPYIVSMLGDSTNGTFEVGGEQECRVPEEFPMKFELDECLNVESGERVSGFVSGGKFMCGDCFYEVAPRSELTYNLHYPTGCYSDCELEVKLDGMAYVNITVGSEVRNNLLIRGDASEKFTVTPGTHEVYVNGERTQILIEDLPEPEFQETWNKKELCITSTWELTDNCFSLSCGAHEVEFIGMYDGHKVPLKYSTLRQCNFLQRLLETIINFFNF
ncbi:MAG: transglutaminase domain-containing protein [Candidatus Altiarchaeota archaeon]|nr:transglutaminase domain-containing protein [Candidatus Altiarchaeota archaeon]